MDTLVIPTEVGKAFLVQLLVRYHQEKVEQIEGMRKSPVEGQDVSSIKRERDAAECVLESLGVKVPRVIDLPIIYHVDAA